MKIFSGKRGAHYPRLTVHRVVDSTVIPHNNAVRVVKETNGTPYLACGNRLIQPGLCLRRQHGNKNHDNKGAGGRNGTV